MICGGKVEISTQNFRMSEFLVLQITTHLGIYTTFLICCEPGFGNKILYNEQK
jgi:hypothetical protein